MNGFFNVSSSPHIRGGESTRSIMYDVALALLPAAAFGVYRFGIYALLVMAVSVIFAVLSEYMFQNLTGQAVTVSDGSALVTGLLLGMNLPPTVPLWIPALGSMFAILFIKQFFGGLGQNFMNPALGARCFLLISFTGIMSNYAVDGISGATPLAQLAEGKTADIAAMFLGFTNGSIGEVSVLALLIGGIYLLVKKIITWEIPVCYLVSFGLFELIFGTNSGDISFVLAQLCGGGLVLGAFFMATDYVTCPITPKGRILYGILLGILTGVLRTFGTTAGGASYAIIIGNLLVPLIEKVTLPTAFGYAPGALEGKKGISLENYKSAAILGGITLAAGLILGGVYQITKGPIEKAGYEAAMNAYWAVMPEADHFTESEVLQAAMAEAVSEDGTVAGGAYGAIVYESTLDALDDGENVVGYVVNVTSRDGFGGEITVSVGMSTDGCITGIEFITLNETAGLGMRAEEETFRSQYVGANVEAFTVTKDTAAAEEEIEAISGATITSTAVTNAVNAALYLTGCTAK